MRGEEEGLKSLSRYIFTRAPSPSSSPLPDQSFRETAAGEVRELNFAGGAGEFFFFAEKNASLLQLEVATLTCSPLPAVKTLLMLRNCSTSCLPEKFRV